MITTLNYTSSGFERTCYLDNPNGATTVVVAFHGHGGSGTEFARVLKPTIATLPLVALACPDGRAIKEGRKLRRGWAYRGPDLFDRKQSVDEDEISVTQLIDTHLNNFSKIILIGYSQGGAVVASMSYLKAHDSKIAGFGIVSSGATPEIITAHSSLLSPPEQTPVFYRCGSIDERVPLTSVERTIAILNSDRAVVDAQIMQGVNHTQGMKRALPALKLWLGSII